MVARFHPHHVVWSEVSTYVYKASGKVAWEHAGADFQSRFDKSTAQAEQMKKRALRVL
jgi:hypothetical protein